MFVRLALRRLLPLLAAIGLVLAPAAASAAAGGMGAGMGGMDAGRHAMPGHHAAMPDVGTMDMDGMDLPGMDVPDRDAEAMPCCPSKAPAAPDCGSGCPLMALCLAHLASLVPAAVAVPVRVAVPVARPRRRDAAFASLAARPPPEPPRS